VKDEGREEDCSIILTAARRSRMRQHRYKGPSQGPGRLDRTAELRVGDVKEDEIPYHCSGSGLWWLSLSKIT